MSDSPRRPPDFLPFLPFLAYLSRALAPGLRLIRGRCAPVVPQRL